MPKRPYRFEHKNQARSHPRCCKRSNGRHQHARSCPRSWNPSGRQVIASVSRPQARTAVGLDRRRLVDHAVMRLRQRRLDPLRDGRLRTQLGRPSRRLRRHPVVLQLLSGAYRTVVSRACAGFWIVMSSVSQVAWILPPGELLRRFKKPSTFHGNPHTDWSSSQLSGNLTFNEMRLIARYGCASLQKAVSRARAAANLQKMPLRPR